MPISLRRVAAAAALLTVVAARVVLAHDWNASQIQWHDYDDALALAKKEGKPICLIVFTEWCPHCANYSKVFHDPKVVDKSKQFVMIRIDNDKNQELSKKFAPDGSYIPRTYFLTSAGVLDADIHAPREQFKFFYDEKNPESVLAAMDAALKKLKN